MRLPIKAVVFGLSLVVSPLGTEGATTIEAPLPTSLSDTPATLCDAERISEPLEPEAASSCFEAAHSSLSVKQPEEPGSSTSLAQDLDGLPHDLAAPGPEPVPAAVGTVPVVTPSKDLTALQIKSSSPIYQVEDNHDVRRFLDQFQTGYRRAVIERWLVRAGRYLPMVLNVFKQKGLPEELVFTAMIESGFDPLAVSRAGAKGLWQFMAPTARRYGLRVDRWMDERLDPEKSTAAAARHFIDLYAVFGSWNLAQAAYNAGERTVLDAIRAMGTSDFWALARGRWLADETKNFIPAIKAATLIAKEPERYGFMVTPAAPLMYDVVAVPGSTSLKLLAGATGLDLDSLERLNPELRLKQTPPDGTYSLKVPVGSAVLVRAALDRDVPGHGLHASPGSGKHDIGGLSPSQRGKPAIHVVKRQETVSTIAKRYRVSVVDLIRWNGLDDTGRIRAGDRLRVTAAVRSEEIQGQQK
ncbi:MAG TPA: transglycosylase SLT domain-containing protein [Candidatus Methylomirabilis sp.]|nr:transglycosylase SLT domain-containing protein [Candidatus Methylomirabilis sp.]